MARVRRGGEPKVRFNVFLGDAQLDDLDALAERDQLRVAEHIRRAIDEYLERKRLAGELPARS